MKKVNRECDIILNEILKLKQNYEKHELSNKKKRASLQHYYDFDQFAQIGGDLLARDLCLVDSCLLVKDKRKTGRVESNLVMVT